MVDDSHAASVIREAEVLARAWPLDLLRSVIEKGKSRLSFGIDKDISGHTAETIVLLERVLSERERSEA